MSSNETVGVLGFELKMKSLSLELDKLFETTQTGWICGSSCGSKGEGITIMKLVEVRNFEPRLVLTN